MIERGHYREAMFWIAVTHSRCRKVLSSDAPADITHGFEESYLEMAGDLGLSTEAGVRERCAEIERALSTVCSLAEEIIATSREIEND
jgi:hypothetical protein